MDPTPSAPMDRYHSRTARLRELRSALQLLHKGMPLLNRCIGGAHHGVISAAAALLAYLPTSSLGLQEGFWSAITAISVTQTEFQATETTARDQFIGAAVGGTVGVCTALLFGHHLAIYGAAIVVSMLVCWTLNVASASRLAGTTATIILLVPHTGTPQQMFIARLTEVGWGICVAVGLVWLAARIPARWGGIRKPPAGG